MRFQNRRLASEERKVRLIHVPPDISRLTGSAAGLICISTGPSSNYVPLDDSRAVLIWCTIAFFSTPETSRPSGFSRFILRRILVNRERYLLWLTNKPLIEREALTTLATAREGGHRKSYSLCECHTHVIEGVRLGETASRGSIEAAKIAQLRCVRRVMMFAARPIDGNAVCSGVMSPYSQLQVDPSGSRPDQ